MVVPSTIEQLRSVRVLPPTATSLLRVTVPVAAGAPWEVGNGLRFMLPGAAVNTAAAARTSQLTGSKAGSPLAALVPAQL